MTFATGNYALGVSFMVCRGFFIGYFFMGDKTMLEKTKQKAKQMSKEETKAVSYLRLIEVKIDSELSQLQQELEQSIQTYWESGNCRIIFDKGRITTQYRGSESFIFGEDIMPRDTLINLANTVKSAVVTGQLDEMMARMLVVGDH